ncbi:hypothetical protein RHECNPAF_1700018 [Rhizobium etli CNPAF512]|nr:hypothetical protein RHECNPAF_1700018 [Rhizobium etli CNPAF512]
MTISSLSSCSASASSSRRTSACAIPSLRAKERLSHAMLRSAATSRPAWIAVSLASLSCAVATRARNRSASDVASLTRHFADGRKP